MNFSSPRITKANFALKNAERSDRYFEGKFGQGNPWLIKNFSQKSCCTQFYCLLR